MGLLDFLFGEKEKRYKCLNCGAKITLDMERCPKCGTRISSMYRKKCPNCGTLNELRAKKCEKCKYDFEAAEALAREKRYKCPICGFEFDYRPRECPVCGTKFIY